MTHILNEHMEMYPIVQRFASSFYSFESVVTETRMVTSSTARWYFFEVGIPPVKKEAPLLQPSNQLRSNALLSLEKRRRNLSAFMQTSSAMSSLVLISTPSIFLSPLITKKKFVMSVAMYQRSLRWPWRFTPLRIPSR